MSTLFIVATPIGNLEDITLRALRVLREADIILCEDTRVTKKLLTHYDIHTPTLSYNEHSGLSKIDKIISLLRDEKTVALVSDAGTPGISDPGARLVMAVLDTLEDSVAIVPVPGPSALIATLSASGLPADDFLFLGFLPHKKGRQTLFEEIGQSKRTAVLYESPHRILKTLSALSDILEPQRHVVVARELTKLFEEITRGTAEEVARYFTDHPEKIKGEFVVVLSGRKR